SGVMSLLSPRLQLKVAQKQILTPGLVQMVTVLQLNRLELKEMISQEVAENPVLEETAEAGEELTPEEVQAILEPERVSEPADKAILDAAEAPAEADREMDAAEAAAAADAADWSPDGAITPSSTDAPAPEPGPAETKDTDPFDDIDFDNFFEQYLEPGFRSPAGESVEKPSWETFVSAPVTLPDHLQSQLSLMVIPDDVRDAADSIIGNLDENGYLTAPLDEIGSS